VRIGLNAGEPIAEERDLFGTAVIMAARIAARALVIRCRQDSDKGRP
jgi:class 3 adenylate cyclase